MQSLCQLDAQGDAFLEHVPEFIAEAHADGRTGDYAHRIVEGAWRQREALDRDIVSVASEWSAERLSPVDRNVLRVALVEFELAEAPFKVIVNEAIEIGREFGTAETPRFINGVLDTLHKRFSPEESSD